MTKVIVVQGVSNSGKTTSIRLFAGNHGVNLPRPPADFVLTMPVNKTGKTYCVCVVTGGDNPDMITKGVNFGLQHKCDYIVAATKLTGATVTHMRSLISQHGLSDVWLATHHVPSLAAQQQQNVRTSQDIENQIR